MQYIVSPVANTIEATDALVLGVFDQDNLNHYDALLDASIIEAVNLIREHGDFTGKLKQHAIHYLTKEGTVKRLILVGCGEQAKFDTKAFRKMMVTAAAQFRSLKIKDCVSLLHLLPVDGADLSQTVRAHVEVMENTLYRFDQYQTQGEKQEIDFTVSLAHQNDDEKEAINAAIHIGQAVAAGKCMARDLGNMPSNVCQPTYLKTESETLAKQYAQLSVEAINEDQALKMGMGCFHAVSKGSEQKGQLITLNYQGGQKGDAPYVFVGKGVTFDSGGISIKPGPGMEAMKMDMCGAASVIGLMKSVCELQLPINVICVVAAVENMPDGTAYRPGDVLTSMAGITVEINNTDAEGRLVLCDALTYVSKFNPKVVIDTATLTGACVIALGKHYSALYSNHAPLNASLKEAGEKSFDGVWPMPLNEDYSAQIKSKVADIKNSAGREAGSVTAACFLAEFTKDYHWAHLDVAGTAMGKAATGRPVPMLVQYLLDECENLA